MKLEVNDVTNAVNEALKEVKLDPTVEATVRVKILNKIQAKTEEAKAEKELESEDKPARKKSQFAIVVSDPDGLITKDLVGWVCTFPEDESPAVVKERIHRAFYDYNASKKGRLKPITHIGEGFEFVPSKFFKSHDLARKTKEAVFVTVTDNVLPKDTSQAK